VIISLSSHHPNPTRSFWLWQTYLNNVNPAAKLLHIPSRQSIILDAASNCESIPANKEALIFSIYLAALNSVPECDRSECERIMGQSLGTATESYIGLAQQALINARFLQTPNFTTLQALVIFLIAQRVRTDPQTLWMLIGLAIRSAQQLGLHREKALQSLSVFEGELGRRTWWEIMLLDSYAAKLCGVMSYAGCRDLWDSKRPLNINDNDLHPDMRELPREHCGITEMSFCSARFEVGEFVIMNSTLCKASQSIPEIDARIEELQQRLQERLLKYCDPAIPNHLMLLMFGKAALARVKLVVRRRNIYTKNGAGLSLEERNKTFLLCLQLIELPNTFFSDKVVQRLLWQANAYFPLDALMFMLGELAYRAESLPTDIAEHAWKEIEKSYKLQPRLAHDRSNVIYSAVRNLTVKAWNKTRMSAQESVGAKFE
jgi:hypothetical protein